MTELREFEERINAQLEPGDLLLYSGKDLISRLIKLKTFSRFSHAEFYLGHGHTLTSLITKGVATYPFKSHDLSCVLRPIDSGYGFDLSEVLTFHSDCIGQAYDTLGLLRFFTIGKQSEDKQFCSEYCARLYRRLRVKLLESYIYFQPFSECYDADLVSPGMFYASPHFKEVWDIKKEKEEEQDRKDILKDINW